MFYKINLCIIILIISSDLHARSFNDNNLYEEILKDSEALKKDARSLIDNIDKKINLSEEKFKNRAINLKNNIGNIKSKNPNNDFINEIINNYSDIKAQKEFKLNELMIFVSSNMPEESLAALYEQSQKVGAILVIRGLVDNSYNKTVKFFQNIENKPVSVIIDPRLFEMFNIEVVPSFVIPKDNNLPCMQSCPMSPLHDKVAGNISLEYALNLLKDFGKYSDEKSSHLLTKLQR